ncbi:hypothetical protein [Campylobacter sp. JMF_03 NE3]|uniref:hypothetical protein n=3 Tax=unclassified Campylobacter TaxID=2593542 RepID=UPI0022EA0284|nr:hypothetical protein [Campylobacter sp. JMF_03 NE3]MDA3053305.1 hypothetical protein [Campylobacter sp. JMF_03 NE3]
MKNKILAFLFLSCATLYADITPVVMQQNQKSDNEFLGEPAVLNFGETWKEEDRAKNSFSKVCPFLTTDKQNNCIITDFSFENRKLFYDFIKINQIKQEDIEKTSNAGVRNTIGGSSDDFNIYDLLGNEPMADIKSAPAKGSDAFKLKQIIDNAEGSNQLIYPLSFNIQGLYANSDSKDASTVSTRPFVGFSGLNVDNSNPYIKMFGGSIIQENVDGITVNSLKGIQRKAGDKINNKYENGDFPDFGLIGFTLADWLKEYGDKTEYKERVTPEVLKAMFQKDTTQDDSQQTWSRVMAGVAVLDDSYIGGIDLSNGELKLRENISKPALNINNEVKTDLEKGNTISVPKDFYGKDTTSTASSGRNNLFSQTSDSKLWGYYVYMSQNLHKLEILLILALAGTSFAFVTGFKGIEYFSSLNSQEQREPLKWKKMIMQPIAYTLIVATPLVSTNTPLETSLLLDTDIITENIKVNRLNINQGDDKNKDLETKFYQTPLQVAIQGGVGLGSAVADEFSRILTYSFATFVAYRENSIDNSEGLLEKMKKEYNGISKDLITISAYQKLYLSTCRNDYTVGDAYRKNISAHTLPKPLNSISNNDMLEFSKKYALDIIKNFNPKYAYLSNSACSKLETFLSEHSPEVLNRLGRFSADFTYHSNQFIKNGAFAKYDEERAKFFKEKFAKLAFYEKNFGWVNVSMIPILYQIMYPSFNPYYYAEKTNALDASTAINTTDDNTLSDLALSQYYTTIGATSTFQEQSNKVIDDNEDAKKVATTALKNGDFTRGDNENLLAKGVDGLLSYAISVASYQFMPGYSNVEQSVESIAKWITNNKGDSDSAKHSQLLVFGEFITTLFLDSSMDYGRSVGGGRLKQIIALTGLSGVLGMGGKELGTASAIVDGLMIKMVAQSLYIYILNLMVMVILSMILMFKIGMFFLQVIVFYIASPLVIIWGLLTKKEEQIKNYIGKSTTLIFTPILIVLSGTILIFGIGIIHQIYFIITNHIMNIELSNAFLAGGAVNRVAQYVQIQAFFGIGTILLGFAYLLLGYVVLIKFSHWFFETVGVQTQSAMNQSLESLTHRMRFGQHIGM